MNEMVKPVWLPLLQRPYENLLGAKNVWDLRMANGTAVRIERGAQGLNNCLYRVRINGDVYACKLFITDERQRARREWTALCSLHEAGLRLAPEPVASAPDGPLPQPAVVYRWVGGESLGGQTLTTEDVCALVTSVNQIHRTPPAAGVEPLVAWHQPESFAAYLGEIETWLCKVRAWIESHHGQASSLPSWLEDLPALFPLMVETLRLAQDAVAQTTASSAYPNPALVRVDGNLDNVVRGDDGRLYFLDWEYSGWGDPAYDLAELRWHPRAKSITAAQWATALAAYTPFASDPGFAERLAVYNRLLPAWWVGRSALHLLEGAGQLTPRPRLAAIPQRMYKAVRTQLDYYLAALGLVEPPEPEERGEE